MHGCPGPGVGGRMGVAARSGAPVRPGWGCRGGAFDYRSRSREEHPGRQRAAGNGMECPAVREQCTGVVEHHDAVTEQAPSLLRMTDRDACGHAIRRQCVCAPGLVFAQDDLRWLASHKDDDPGSARRKPRGRHQNVLLASPNAVSGVSTKRERKLALMKAAECRGILFSGPWPAAEHAEPARATTLNGTSRGPGRGGQEGNGAHRLARSGL
jgi:hypothetical protein